MPEVICNTSPLQYLHQAGILHLLPSLTGKIIIPPAVAAELTAGKKAGIDLPDITSLAWLELRLPMSATALPLVTDLGNLEILKTPSIALFCSTKCPGDLILKTYDLACAWRDTQQTVIGGFHSPMEKECLQLLLRATQPVIICPARFLTGMRLPREWRQPLENGRLLLLSSFAHSQRRVSAGLAQQRNEFVAALADQIFIDYAAPGSKTEGFVHPLLTRGKPVWTFPGADNAAFNLPGVSPIAPDKFTGSAN